MQGTANTFRLAVLISTVGPYHKYGSHAFAACAETGTHYIDCTGEVPWVYDMIKKYDSVAKSNGAILIPQNGVESAPTDLVCQSLSLVNTQSWSEHQGASESFDLVLAEARIEMRFRCSKTLYARLTNGRSAGCW